MIIPVVTDTKSYDIIIGNDILKSASNLINLDRKILIVTDSGVPYEYANTIKAQCAYPFLVTIPSGEESKCFSQFESLLSKMLEFGFTRGDAVIAVGGGVVGDISGFVASTYMRGIDFYNIPTTLLSQVDSSVGGKTAIDFCGVKNVVGTFYQPSKVIIDTATLKTLNKRQLLAGLTEAIKMSATLDSDLFDFIEKSTDLDKDLPKIIEGALKIKKRIVEEDTKETGIRRVLNFGHTIGHAIESSQKGRLLHGECVALGMLPFSAGNAKARIINILQKYGINTTFTDKDKLLPYILHDKKQNNSKITTVFTDKIGTFYFEDLTPNEIMGLLEDF